MITIPKMNYIYIYRWLMGALGLSVIYSILNIAILVLTYISPGPPKIPLSYRSGIRTFWAIFGLNAVRNPDILTQNPGQGRS